MCALEQLALFFLGDLTQVLDRVAVAAAAISRSTRRP